MAILFSSSSSFSCTRLPSLMLLFVITVVSLQSAAETSLSPTTLPTDLLSTSLLCSTACLDGSAYPDLDAIPDYDAWEEMEMDTGSMRMGLDMDEQPGTCRELIAHMGAMSALFSAFVGELEGVVYEDDVTTIAPSEPLMNVDISIMFCGVAGIACGCPKTDCPLICEFGLENPEFIRNADDVNLGSSTCAEVVEHVQMMGSSMGICNEAKIMFNAAGCRCRNDVPVVEETDDSTTTSTSSSSSSSSSPPTESSLTTETTSPTTFLPTTTFNPTVTPPPTSFPTLIASSDVDYQSIAAIFIDPSCIGDNSVPNTMFIIFPSDEDTGSVTIETSPSNLVTAVTVEYGDDSYLEFEWNTEVSSTATSGGVRIGVPPDQLQEVEVSGGHHVQILDGFTNITSLYVGGDGSILRASMTSSISAELDLGNDKGRMYVETNIPVGYSFVERGGKSWIETPLFNYNIEVGGTGSELNIKGDVDVTSSYLDNYVYDGAQLTVTGTITGNIYNVDGSSVNAPSCDNITSDGNSTCNAGPQNVAVDVGGLTFSSQVRNGTYICVGKDFYTACPSPSSTSYPSLVSDDFVVTPVDAVLAEDDNDSTVMTLIDSDIDYQNIISIFINPSTGDGEWRISDLIYTIFPSNDGCGVTIETTPPNLVTVGTLDGFLYYSDDNDPAVLSGLKLDWNADVSSTVTSGGVRIGVPQGQLKKVYVWGRQYYNVQILDGFTNISYLHVSHDPAYGRGSILRASMTSSTSTLLELDNDGGQMYVETNVPVMNGGVSRGGQSWVETPSFNGHIEVSGAGSKLNIKGNADADDGSVNDGAQLTVTGRVTGSIASYNNSTVNALSCDNINSSEGSTCNAGSQNVDIDVGDLSQNNQILNDTYICAGDDSSTTFFSPSMVPNDFVVPPMPPPITQRPTPVTYNVHNQECPNEIACPDEYYIVLTIVVNNEIELETVSETTVDNTYMVLFGDRNNGGTAASAAVGTGSDDTKDNDNSDDITIRGRRRTQFVPGTSIYDSADIQIAAFPIVMTCTSDFGTEIPAGSQCLKMYVTFDSISGELITEDFIVMGSEVTSTVISGVYTDELYESLEKSIEPPPESKAVVVEPIDKPSAKVTEPPFKPTAEPFGIVTVPQAPVDDDWNKLWLSLLVIPIFPIIYYFCKKKESVDSDDDDNENATLQLRCENQIGEEECVVEGDIEDGELFPRTSKDDSSDNGTGYKESRGDEDDNGDNDGDDDGDDDGDNEIDVASDDDIDDDGSNDSDDDSYDSRQEEEEDDEHKIEMSYELASQLLTGEEHCLS